MSKNIERTQVSWHEFGCRDDANAWRKSTKEADKEKKFYCNLESINLSMHLHHLSRQRTSAESIIQSDFISQSYSVKF